MSCALSSTGRNTLTTQVGVVAAKTSWLRYSPLTLHPTLSGFEPNWHLITAADGIEACAASLAGSVRFLRFLILTLSDDSFGKNAHGLNVSAWGKSYARPDVHVGPGSAHHLFCGLPGPILRICQLGEPIPSLSRAPPPRVSRPHLLGRAVWAADPLREPKRPHLCLRCLRKAND
jgi:hypothetical protein